MKKIKKQKKAASLAAVLCFVATIAIVGAYTLSGNNQSPSDREAQEEKMAKKASTTAKDPVKNLVLDSDKGAEPSKDNAEAADKAEEKGEVSQPKPVVSQGTGIYFQEGNKLLWPVEGTVLMAYSMDKTVYHRTLDQYKYNPALVLSAAEGDQVICGGTGIIKSIDNDARTGMTVNVDFGNGYEALYGQLCDVPVRVGDYVEGKSLLGFVTKPTKYYSMEGPNVYFEMRKDGLPVNPGEYLAEDW